MSQPQARGQKKVKVKQSDAQPTLTPEQTARAFALLARGQASLQKQQEQLLAALNTIAENTAPRTDAGPPAPQIATQGPPAHIAHQQGVQDPRAQQQQSPGAENPPPAAHAGTALPQAHNTAPPPAPAPVHATPPPPHAPTNAPTPTNAPPPHLPTHPPPHHPLAHGPPPHPPPLPPWAGMHPMPSNLFAPPAAAPDGVAQTAALEGVTHHAVHTLGAGLASAHHLTHNLVQMLAAMHDNRGGGRFVASRGRGGGRGGATYGGRSATYGGRGRGGGRSGGRGGGRSGGRGEHHAVQPQQLCEYGRQVQAKGYKGYKECCSGERDRCLAERRCFKCGSLGHAQHQCDLSGPFQRLFPLGKRTRDS